jgi:hypothetical protein
MASRSFWDFYPFYLGRFANLMLTVMPVLFAIPDADACSLKALSQTNKMANS